MGNLDFIFDKRSFQFIDERTGFIIHAEDVMMKETQELIDEISAGTGEEVDYFFIEILRDTVEVCIPTLPFGN